LVRTYVLKYMEFPKALGGMSGVLKAGWMMAPTAVAVPPAPDGEFRFWLKDRARVEQEIVDGLPFRVLESERGRYDAMLDFLLHSGLWAAATEMRPSGLKKDNGIPYRCLNGLECLREMAGIDTPAECGPLLKDAYLLERTGFTAEKVERSTAQERNIIHPESLLNHLARFTEADLETGFLAHLGVIRQKRWLRGGVYAVDGHDILIPYGKGYEGARRISEGSYGYKLLVLLNIQEDCELVAGYVLGGLEESEYSAPQNSDHRLSQDLAESDPGRTRDHDAQTAQRGQPQLSASVSGPCSTPGGVSLRLAAGCPAGL